MGSSSHSKSKSPKVKGVLQCVAGCCRVLQGVAVCCSVLQCVAVCCSVLQSVLQCVAVFGNISHKQDFESRLCVLQYVAVFAVCCSMMQCIAMSLTN